MSTLRIYHRQFRYDLSTYEVAAIVDRSEVMNGLWLTRVLLVVFGASTSFVNANAPICRSPRALQGLCASDDYLIRVSGFESGCAVVDGVEACRDLCNSAAYQGQPSDGGSDISDTCRSFQFGKNGQCCLYKVASSVATESLHESPLVCADNSFYDFPCSFNTTCEDAQHPACPHPNYILFTGGPTHDGITYTVDSCLDLCARTFSESGGTKTCHAIQFYQDEHHLPGTCRTLGASYQLAIVGQQAICDATYYNLPCGSPECFAIQPHANKGSKETIMCTFSAGTSLRRCRDNCAASPLPCNAFQYFPEGPAAGTCCLQRTSAQNAVDAGVVLEGAQFYDFPCRIAPPTNDHDLITNNSLAMLYMPPLTPKDAEVHELRKRQAAAPTTTVTMVCLSRSPPILMCRCAIKYLLTRFCRVNPPCFYVRLGRKHSLRMFRFIAL